jgi:uroporphyrinogen decarboxylase
LIGSDQKVLNLDYKERFKRCMNHEETDRVPVDLWIDSHDPAVKANLLKSTGFDKYENLLDYLDIDLYRFKSTILQDKLNPESELEKYFIPSNDEKLLTLSSEMPRPLLNVEEPEELVNFVWPSPDVFDYAGLLKFTESQENRVLWAQPGDWSPFFCRMCDLAGMEKILMDMILNPPLIEAMIEKIFYFYSETFKRTLEATKGKLDVFSFGDDYATQINMMFDAKYWKKYFKEPVRKLCDLVKSYGVYVSFHSCGSVEKIIPDLIDAGVDILFPIQPKAKGMGAEHLKKEFGKDVVFYGGIDLQEILPYGTEQQVRDEVNRVVNILGKDGGYIMASAHGMLKDVPQANILAMYDEVRRISFRK